MSWLDAMQISALVTFLIGVGVAGLIFLLLWAQERDRDLEVFLGIVMAAVWIAFTFVLHKME